jgi:hypothetical protein
MPRQPPAIDLSSGEADYLHVVEDWNPSKRIELLVCDVNRLIGILKNYTDEASKYCRSPPGGGVLDRGILSLERVEKVEA